MVNKKYMHSLITALSIISNLDFAKHIILLMDYLLVAVQTVR